MKSFNAYIARLLALLVAAGCLVLLPTGCNRGSNSVTNGKTKVRVVYIGLTCEAPIFVAAEKGFFDEEGLDVELIKTDWNGLREGLGLGRFDANHTLIMYLLQAIEKGSDLKITGGVHKGCLRLQAGANSDIQKVADFRGKRIGVPNHVGSPPYMFSCRVLAANGMDPQKDVVWQDMQPDALALALKNGQIDAIATSDPLGTILVGNKTVRTIADQSLDQPYADEYCCATVVNGEFAKRDPAAAAKVTRAMLKGARWVEENPTAAATLSVEKKYIASSIEMNALALSHLKYLPGVSGCRDSVLKAAKDMKVAGLLAANTDPTAMAQRAWLDLDGVTDQWVEGLKVEKVAGGGPLPPIDPAVVAALCGKGDWADMCCVGQ